MIATVAGCSFKAPTETNGSIDAPKTGDDTAVTDAGLPSTLGCWPRWHDHSIRFKAPVASGIFDTRSGGSIDRDPSLADDLTLYFSSQSARSSQADLFVATRTSIDMPFGAATVPAHFDNLEQPFGDTKVSLSHDGLRITYSTDRFIEPDIVQATRDTTSDDFGDPTQDGFSNIDTASPQYDPALTANGLKMYYAPVPGTDPQTIMSSTRATLDSEFGDPVAEPGLESSFNRGDPSPSPDETVIVFSSMENTANGVDLYYAVRDTSGEPWKQVMPIPDVNTSSTEGDPVLTSDGCQLLFASDRGRGAFAFTILMTTATDGG